MDTRYEIGNRIRDLREAIKSPDGKSMTQEEMAKTLGISRGALAKWETGERVLKAENIIKLADFFDVTCDEILRGIKAENVHTYHDLGLDDKSISELQKIKKWGEGYVIGEIMLEILNTMLGRLYPTLRRIADYTLEAGYYKAQKEFLNDEAEPRTDGVIVVSAEEKHELRNKRLLLEVEASRILSKSQTTYKLVPPTEYEQIKRARIERSILGLFDNPFRMHKGKEYIPNWAKYPFTPDDVNSDDNN